MLETVTVFSVNFLIPQAFFTPHVVQEVHMNKKIDCVIPAYKYKGHSLLSTNNK